jgi:hypothetical protein
MNNAMNTFHRAQMPNMTFILSLAFFVVLGIGVASSGMSDPRRTVEQEESVSETGSSLWSQVKGRRARNALLPGMWSIHMDGGGELFGGPYNEQNHLMGIRYGGLGFGTFINSHDDRTYFTGFAREIHSASYSLRTRIDTGYLVGAMYGYGDNLPNVWGISPQFLLTFGFSWRRLAIDLGWSPLIVATFNFRIDLE